MNKKDLEKININDRGDRLSVRFPDGLIATLEELAHNDGRDLTGYIVKALYDHVLSQIKKKVGTK
jgi:hypothetical protein